MEDVWFGIAINLAASSAAGFAIRQLSRQWPLRWVDASGGLLFLLLVGYIVWIWDHPILARWFPFSNLIVLSNALPLFAALLAGLTCRRLRGRPLARNIAVAMLMIAGVGALVRPLIGQLPQCDNRWEAGICLQSTPHTCSAASAVNVLQRVGISTSESEMARLCLTRKGTHWMGLYRGLRRKLGHGWRVDVLDGEGLDSLRRVSESQPAILTVELPQELPVNWQYRQESGWLPGVSHSVVCLGSDGHGQWQIIDPANGLERWSTSDLQVLWQGQGMRLMR